MFPINCAVGGKFLRIILGPIKIIFRLWVTWNLGEYGLHILPTWTGWLYLGWGGGLWGNHTPFILRLNTFYILQNIFNNFPTYSNISLPFEMPTQATFNAIDGEGNNDSILTMEEWAQFVGCE